VVLIGVLATACVLLTMDLAGWMIRGPAALRLPGLELPVGRFEAEASIAALLAAGMLALAGRLHTRWGSPLAAAALTASVLLANTLPLGSGDTVPATLLPFALLRDGRVTFEDTGLDEPLGASREPLPYYLVRAGPRLASKYSPAMGVLAAPVYLPAALGRFDPCRPEALHLGKLAAALLTALGAACLFVAARRLVGSGWAWATLALYVLGTPVLSVLGQALWQHTGAALGLSIALLALTLHDAGDRCLGLFAGAGLGLAMACRPIDLLLAAGVAIVVLRTRPRAIPWMAVASAVPLLLLGWYQWRVFGSPLSTGYGAEAHDGWTTPFAEGVTGLMVSPARGLIVHAPIVLVALGALLPGSRAPRWLGWPVLSAVLFLLLIGRWWCWNGGYAFGNRMLSDALPILFVAMACGLPVVWSRPALRPAVVALGLVSIATFGTLTYVRPGPQFRDRVLELTGGPWDPGGHPLVALVEQVRRPEVAQKAR
jgi:hypothetical protein